MTYHSGSRAVQDRVGVRSLADHVGQAIGQGIRPVVAAFLEQQPMLVLGGADPATGALWASLLTGEPGFVRATGPQRMSVIGAPHAGDPLAAALRADGTPVGTLALDPRTRRRVRLNGRAHPTPRGLVVETDQVFGNCPKYLQRRASYERVERTPAAARRSAGLTARQREFIRAADTFFLATVHAHGADASHRGGNPGFVHTGPVGGAGPDELSWRDYSGNAMFLSLGNLAADPRAGLLFLDWASGAVLQLTGTARTEFGADGKTRTVRFSVTEAVETPGASSLRWSPPEYSPANPELP